MDLAFLIPSKVRRAVLNYFVSNPEAKPCIRELARELKLSPQMVYRELLNLESWGFLFSSKQANLRVFRLNNKFPCYLPIRELWQRWNLENNRAYQIDKIYRLEDEVRRLKKIPIAPALMVDLRRQRKKPRAYDEEKLLGKKQT